MFVATQIRRPQHHRGENAGGFLRAKLPVFIHIRPRLKVQSLKWHVIEINLQDTVGGGRQVCLSVFQTEENHVEMVDNFFMVRKVRNS